MTKHERADVVLITWHPGDELDELLGRLEAQSVRPGHILVVNTEERYWKDEWETNHPSVEVFHINEEDYDHAGTRNMGAGLSGADYLVFMTQDAMPSDSHMIARLLGAFRNPMVKAAWARQVPGPDSGIPEALLEEFDFPEGNEIFSSEDLAAMGTRAARCPNACAAYERRTFMELGGFTEPCAANEDMIYSARIMTLGYSVAYVSGAKVYHSYRFTNDRIFRGSFDDGASMAMHPELFSGIRMDGEWKEARRYVLKNLRRIGRGELAASFRWQCFLRRLGYRLGSRWTKLPKKMVRACGLNQTFWKHVL